MAGCSQGRAVASLERAPEATGRARVQVSLRAASAPTVSRVSVTVGAGDGPVFTPIVEDLPRSGDSWGGYITGIPAGPGRAFDVAAMDGSGRALFTGSGKADVGAGGESQVAIALQEVPGIPFSNSIPVIEKVTASAGEVRPGEVVLLHVVAHDPDAGGTVSYLWTASNGTFDALTQADVRWTAPDVDATVDLVITVSDNSGGSASAIMKVKVKRGRTVSGSRLVSHWPDPPSSVSTRPAPDVAWAAAPRALVRDSGSWVENASGTLRPDGTYVIPDVPPGSYVLCYDPPGSAHVCTDTAADSVDLGYDVLGRPDQARATTATPVNLSLTGLDPWNPIWEQVQITSSGANLWDVAATGPSFRGGDVAGAVVEDWFRAKAGGKALGLLASTDVLFVHQLATRSIYVGQGIAFYSAATRASSASAGVRLHDGQPASIAAALTQLSLTGQLAVAWDPPSFEAHLASLAPAARRSAGPAAHTIYVGASPAPLDRPGPAMAGGFPQMVRLELPAGSGPISDTLYFGRFLPSTWPEWRGARFAARVSYLAPGATLPLIEESVVERRDAMPAPAGPLGPSVSPPRSPKVNDLDALADQASVGPTPTFSWLAPAVGTPTAYVVEVYRLAASGAASTSALVLRYSTRGTSLTIPPRVLESGATHYARIGARIGSVTYDTAPCRTSNVESAATVLTGTFVP
jgi:hypothetical protein